MTKRRLTQKGKPGQKKGPSAMLILACALMSGFTLALASNSPVYEHRRLTSIADLALHWPEPWKDLHFSAPRVLTPIEWPNWVLGRNEETRNKSEPDAEPAIAIVIDDLGNDPARTREAIALPQKITLSFLPYATASHALSHQAHLAGHEVMVHLPMQPVGVENPGPMVLKANLSPGELVRRVDWALNRVSDFTGANNHMGSNFTASRSALIPVMQELAAHGMFFLDSRTTPTTQAEDVAREAGMLAGSRDVFLDDDKSAAAVQRQLKLVEDRARANGSAIAIGHPHGETLTALKVWAAKLPERGFRLAPVSEVLHVRAKNKPSRLISSFFNAG